MTYVPNAAPQEARRLRIRASYSCGSRPASATRRRVVLRGSKGFTLVEILVVIAIIVLLAALLFPVFSQAKGSAQESSDASVFNQIGTAITIYTTDYNDVYPSQGFMDRTIKEKAEERSYRWSSSLCVGSYLKDMRLFRSSLDRSWEATVNGIKLIPATRSPYPMSYVANSFGAFTCDPADKVDGSTYFGLPAGMDVKGLMASGSWLTDPTDPANVGRDISPVPASLVVQPADLVMLANGQLELEEYAGCGATAANTEVDYCAVEDLVDGYYALSLAQGGFLGSPDSNLHHAWRKSSDKSNFMYADIHVKAKAPTSFILNGHLDPKEWLVVPSK